VGPKTGWTIWKSEHVLPYRDPNYYSSAAQGVAMCVTCAFGLIQCNLRGQSECFLYGVPTDGSMLAHMCCQLFAFSTIVC
jgi:hypothetical protein